MKNISGDCNWLSPIEEKKSKPVEHTKKEFDVKEFEKEMKKNSF